MVAKIGLVLALMGCLGGGLFATAAEGQGQFVPYGEGMPGPWPFPWAEGCEFSWASLKGHYIMIDRVHDERMELRISVARSREGKRLRIARYIRGGVRVAEGWAPLVHSQRSVEVLLTPKFPGVGSAVVDLRMHFDSTMSCKKSRLVPILSLREEMGQEELKVTYRLVNRPSVAR